MLAQSSKKCQLFVKCLSARLKQPFVCSPVHLAPREGRTQLFHRQINQTRIRTANNSLYRLLLATKAGSWWKSANYLANYRT